MNDNRIERKVVASSCATVAAGLVVMLLGEHVFKGDVPQPVIDAVYVLVPAGAAFIGGWWAKHTHRPDT